MEQAPLTLDAYLDGAAPSLPQGDALADVVSRLAKAAVELADLIAAGPFAGIDGTAERHQFGRRRADRSRHRGQHADVQRASRRAGRRHRLRGNRPAGDPSDRSRALRRDRSARRLGQSRQQHLDGHDLLDPAAVARCALLLLRARHGAARGGLLHLWSADDAGARARRQRRHLHCSTAGRATSS